MNTKLNSIKKGFIKWYNLHPLSDKLSYFNNKIINKTGKFLSLVMCVSLSQIILQSYSINLLQPFYIKLFFLFSITILLIFTLDYLIKYIIYIYLLKNKNLIINKNYPNLIYNYLNELKLLSEIDFCLKNFYLYNFIIYLVILIMFIFIYLYI